MRFVNRSTPARSFLLAALACFLAFVSAVASGPDGQPRNLYVVSVGQTYTRGGQKQSKLPCCEKDAIDIVRWAESQKGKLFENVQARTMVDAEAKADDILAAVRDLKGKVKAGDYAIVYLSGHGGTGAKNQFEFCAHDRNVAWGQIQTALRDTAGTVIVILDACHSGAVTADSNLIVFSASLKDENSLGGADKDHNSLYTQFFLEAVTGKADINQDGFVSLAEVDAYVSGQLAMKKVSASTTLRPANVPSVLPLAKLAASPTTPTSLVQPVGNNLAGTTWSGSEDLGGFGKLTFKFAPGGKATMIDAQRSVAGTYTVTGNQVTIRLPGLAPYVGTIAGTTIAGQATSDSATWSFRVTKQ